MENIFLLVVIAIVGLVQLMMRAAEARRNAQAKKQSSPRTVNAPIPQASAESEEERVRKFFEALGVPTTSTPPTRVPPRPIAPKTPRTKRKIMPVDPFPVPRAGIPIPPIIPSAPSIPTTPFPPREISPLPTGEPSILPDSPAAKPQPVLPAAEFEVRGVEHDVADDRPTSTLARETAVALGTSKAHARDIVARLATAEGLRDAMVLREIFGPPRSMQTQNASLPR